MSLDSLLRRNGKVIYSVLVSIILFMATQFMFFYRDIALLEDTKLELNDQLFQSHQEIQKLKTEIITKDRDLYRIGRRVKDLELWQNAAMKRGDPAATTRLYIVTPTHSRPTQKADLTRLAQTLMLVSNLHWVVVEDADAINPTISRFLNRTQISFTYLNAATPNEHKLQPGDKPWSKSRGVTQRNAGLQYLRTNLLHRGGVVYFADDDNTYDLRLFDLMRTTNELMVWPVGLVGGLLVEVPICDFNGKLIKFDVIWRVERPFPLDMASFAVNAKMLTMPARGANAWFSYNSRFGPESSFVEDLQINRSNWQCATLKEVFVWHTQTARPNLNQEDNYLKSNKQNSNRYIEV